MIPPSYFTFAIISLLLPAIAAQSTNLTTPSNAADFGCLNLRVFDLRLGLVQNCAAAILSLRQQSVPVYFHRNGLDDIGRLPVIETHGDCRLKVDLIDPYDEFGTWIVVGLAASLLMTACTDISLNRPYTGGYVLTGDRRAINVTLERYEPGLGVGNGSAVSY